MLILVRHGQTEPNVRGLLLGRADPPLTRVGWRQAVALADALPLPARVVSSPLTRARQTAAVLAGHRAGAAPPDMCPGPGAVAVEVDERWVEMDYGELDCRPPSALGPGEWRAWRDDPDFVPAGGESVAAVCARVRAACRDLAAAAARCDVVVVSHVSPIKAAVTWALGIGDGMAWRMYLSDAAVCRIDTAGRRPRLLGFNETPAGSAVSRART